MPRDLPTGDWSKIVKQPLPTLALERSRLILPLFCNHFVGPLHERNKDCGISVLCSVVAEIGLGYATSPGAGATGINRNVPGRELVQCLGHLPPTHARHR